MKCSNVARSFLDLVFNDKPSPYFIKELGYFIHISEVIIDIFETQAWFS